MTVDKGIETPFEWVEALFNNVYLSIMTARGSLFWAPAFGCLLHTIRKVNDENALSARDMIIDATKWIIELGRATDIEVVVLPNGGRFDIAVAVARANDTTKHYTLWYDVV